MKSRIHIFGASGSGTTTIAQVVAKTMGYKHFDTDDYYWLDTGQPYAQTRPIEERIALMEADLDPNGKWILSGSLDSWGDPLVPLFELVVFVYSPTELRIGRLEKRELERYGQDALPGGERHSATREFIEWAKGYDSGSLAGRSLPRHEAWLEKLECDVVRVTNINLEVAIDVVIRSLKN